MTAHIRVLPEETINKVAAGEVVENSASVVKELVENAIDAEAKNITIEIRGGGRELIRITDDGVGMGEDDALLAFERHATSKIRTIDDIHQVMSMGFRGEAVPSIAAISKFTLLTRPEKSKDATLVIVDGGRIMKASTAPRSPGTTIEVQSLFFNVPVRRKFQKAPAHDEGEILKIVSQLALGHPHIRFEVISQGNPLLTTLFHNENCLKERIREVLGADFAKSLVPVSAQGEGISIEGFISNPYTTRPNRTGQHLFINRRAVFAPVISHAVLDGYGTAITPKRYPLFVLHLQMTGDEVDVNVHPQKKEVRFRRAMHLREIMQKAVEQTLQKRDVPQRTSGSFNPATGPSWNNIFEATGLESVRESSASLAAAPAANSIVSSPKKVRMNVLGTVPGFILAEGRGCGKDWQEGLLAIDQKGAHARVLYEAAQKKGKTSQTQKLLVPVTLSMSKPEAARARQCLSELSLLGIDIYESGPETFLIDAIPSFLESADIADIIEEIVQAIGEKSTDQIREEKLSKNIAQAATFAAVPSKRRLSLEQAQQLLDALSECEEPLTAPSGRKTLSWLTPEELAKLF